MKWRVIYEPDAADELTAIWLGATDRKAVTEAAHLIDKQLGNNPLSAGESRGGNSRVLCEPPLAVFFDVNEQDRAASVWGITFHQ